MYCQSAHSSTQTHTRNTTVPFNAAGVHPDAVPASGALTFLKSTLWGDDVLSLQHGVQLVGQVVKHAPDVVQNVPCSLYWAGAKGKENWGQLWPSTHKESRRSWKLRFAASECVRSHMKGGGVSGSAQMLWRPCIAQCTHRHTFLLDCFCAGFSSCFSFRSAALKRSYKALAVAGHI